MRALIFIVASLLLIYLLYIYYPFEHFQLKKNQLNNFIECCSKYGCNSFNCQYLNMQTNAPSVLIGAIKYNDKISPLYQRLNHLTQNYEYFYLFYNDAQNDKINDPVLLQLNSSNIKDKQTIKINNNIDATIHLFSLDVAMSQNYHDFDNLNSFPKFKSFDISYSNRNILPKILNIGYIKSNDNEKYELYEQQIVPRRGVYKYFTKIDGNLIEISEIQHNYWDTIANKINNGDLVKVPLLNKFFVYYEK